MEFIKIDSNFKDKEKLYSLNDEAFPKEERIPSEKLITLLDECGCDGWAFYDDEFAGFAIIITDSENRECYLSYFAIDKKFRGQGKGSKALQKLQNVYSDYQIALDMERIDEVNAENFEQRKKRVAFYERNGFKRAKCGISFFGINLEIMCNKGEFRKSEFEKVLTKIKIKGFEPKLYDI